MPEEYFNDPNLGKSGDYTRGVTPLGEFTGPGLITDVTYVLEKRYLNTFRKSPMPGRDMRRTGHERTGRTREAKSEDGKLCWTECEVIDRVYVRRAFMIEQKYELWRVNITLQNYYDSIGGWGYGGAASGAGLGATVAQASWLKAGAYSIGSGGAAFLAQPAVGVSIPGLVPVAAELGGAAASGAVAAAGTAAGVAAAAMGGFYLGTMIAKELTPAGEKQGDSWDLVDVILDPEVKESEGTPRWEQIGEAHPCPEGKKVGFPWWPWFYWHYFLWFLLGVLLMLLLVLLTPLGAVLGGYRALETAAAPPAESAPVAAPPVEFGPQEVPALPEPASAAPAATEPVPTAPPATSTAPPATATSPPLLSGGYSGSIPVTNDPAGHAPFIGPMPTRLDVLQTRNTQTGEITVRISGPAPWVEVVGNPEQSETPFTAKGTGTVAGFSGVEVTFSGNLTFGEGLSGTLVVGSNGRLPTGQPAIYQVRMTKQPG